MGFTSFLTTTTKCRRRKSDKCKEKSREASRNRRSRESEILNDMANLLPVPLSLSSQLDKTSILRLTTSFLKAQSLLDSSMQMLFSMLNEDKCSMADACWLTALGDSMLLALTSEGDVIYLSDNVTQQLGFHQLDFFGKSIYDYCHPCDHDELRECLSLRPDGELARSGFIRFRSTLKIKGQRNNNQKADKYKVMNCSGRVALATASKIRFNYSLDGYFNEVHKLFIENDLKVERDDVKSSVSHYLVLVCDPIPHPSNIKLPLDSFTFLTNHTLDMKYTYVDDKISKLFGYTLEDLKGHSAYQFHHAQDNESILKSYKTMFIKGQIQTPPYRFLAKQGGYAWLQTQATLVSVSSRFLKSQAVVCIHTCLSGIEDGDQILFVGQEKSAIEWF